ncbi:MAG: sialate O-acetylesterase [Pirellulales bacterium]|nr:sialate O-acetylesterase [Pirellulales bacterium]
MPRPTWLLSFVFAICLTALPGIAPAVELPAVFSHHMVLQRDQPIPIWGWSEPGEEITVQLADLRQQTTADKYGNWRVDLTPLAAGGPHELRIVGKNSITYKDVLIGEVWLCSGQSNMQWGLESSARAGQDIPAAKHANIRLLTVPLIASGVPQTNFVGEWLPCTPDNARKFSAVAYYFGKKLHGELNVPIGLINSSWGGTAIEPWTPLAGFDHVPGLQHFSQQIRSANQQYQRELPESLDRQAAWGAKIREIPFGQWPPQPALVQHPLVGTGPGCIYNAMIHPLRPYGMRGVIWYQGEANNGQGMEYYEKMQALIHGWRGVWQQGDFPFYYVQLAPYARYADGNLEGIWDAQLRALAIPQTGMAVTTDLVNNVNDIHPNNKHDVGERLALWALAKTYGKRDLVYSGPLFKSAKRDGQKFIIEFEHADGLKTRDGQPPSHLEVGTLEKFVPAQGTIEGTTLTVWSDDLPDAEFVRFGWNKSANPNLINGAGLPASPFRNYCDAVKVTGNERFTDAQDLTLQMLGNSGEVRYTLDGAVPTQDSPLFDKTVKIHDSVKIRTRLFTPTGRSSLVSEATFTKVEPLEYQGKKLVPGWHYDYFESRSDLARLPNLDEMTRLREGVIDGLKFDMARPAGNYALRFRGVCVLPQAGPYTFTLASDDGSRLRVNGRTVVENDGIHPAIEKSGDPIELPAGPVELEIEYFQGGGTLDLKLLYAGPNLPKQPLPASAIYCLQEEPVVAPSAAAQGQLVKKVLLVGIDGVRGDAIEYSQAENLKQLIATGAYTDKMDVLGQRKTNADTASGSGWSTIINGIQADKHGIVGNDFRGHKLAAYPSFLARIKSARPAAEVAAFVSWQPMYDHCLAQADFARLVLDGDKNGYRDADRLVAEAAAKYLETSDPAAIFVYFGHTDSAGHGYGFHPKSYKYTNAIEEVDLHLAKVLAAVKNRKTAATEDWLIMVCTDHGGQGRGHSGGRDIPEIRNGFCILSGRGVKPGRLRDTHANVDLYPTILRHLEVEIPAKWNLDGQPIDYEPATEK